MLAGLGLVAGASIFGSPRLHDHLIEAAPPCPFLTVTGLPCPFCGLSRATLALGSGDFGAAFNHHPFAPVILGLTVWGAVLLARGTPPPLTSPRVAVGGAVALVAFWIAAFATRGG